MQEHDAFIQSQLSRIDNEVRSYKRRINIYGLMVAPFFIASVTYFSVLAVVYLFIFDFVNGIFYMALSMRSGFLLLTGSNFVLKMYGLASATFSLSCPYCERDINLAAPFKCGWCGHSEPVSEKRKPPLATEPCPSCKKTPAALMCPGCGDDVHLIPYAEYEKLPPQGQGVTGTITGLRLKEET